MLLEAVLFTKDESPMAVLYEPVVLNTRASISNSGLNVDYIQGLTKPKYKEYGAAEQELNDFFNDVYKNSSEIRVGAEYRIADFRLRGGYAYQGNNFDSTTGKFTAPVAGIYNVSLVARVADYNGLNQIAVLKNGNNSSGNVVCFWETDTNTGTATHFTSAGTIQLAVGDYLSANILNGNITFDELTPQIPISALDPKICAKNWELTIASSTMANWVIKLDNNIISRKVGNSYCQ